MYYDRLKSRVRASNAARRRQQEAKALIDCIDVKQHIAPVYYPLHEDVKAGRHSTYNLPGGRGSCKSESCRMGNQTPLYSVPWATPCAIVAIHKSVGQ